MTKDLLWRGMLAGVLAALLATVFARVYAEPLVDRAIGFEESHARPAMAHMHADAGPPVVSRATQRGAGLTTAVILYGAAVGGIFALIFAYCHGRVGRIGPRSLALVIAGLGFLVVVVVPAIKYPANPPAVGQSATLQLRTAAYFGMVAISIVALMLAGRVRVAVAPRLGMFNALVVAAAVYVLAIILAQIGLPVTDEVPAGFPGSLLWNYRIATLGIQLILWSALGLGFGWLAEKCLTKAKASR